MDIGCIILCTFGYSIRPLLKATWIRFQIKALCFAFECKVVHLCILTIDQYLNVCQVTSEIQSYIFVNKAQVLYLFKE